MGEGLLGVEDEDARHHDERQQSDEGGDRAQGNAGRDDRGDGPRDEDGLGDDEQGGRATGQGGGDDVAPSRARVAHQPRVQRLHHSRIVFLGLSSLVTSVMM